MLTERIQLWPDREDVILQAYILDDSAEYLQGRRRPAVLICPGGAYLATSDREAEPVAMRFAGQGYHAFVLRYTTYFGGDVGESFQMLKSGQIPAGNPKSAYPGPLLDLGKAMLTIRENASRWHLDYNQIVVCGFSAGGHLAASLGVHWHEKFMRDQLSADNAKFRPAALILGYPLIDYRVMKKAEETIEASNQELVALWHVSNLAVFANPEPSPEELIRLSPVCFVSEQTSPAFIWHTAADGLVPVANAFNFAAALVEKGIPCELHVFAEGDHGLSLADSSTAISPEQIIPSVQIWVQLALTWLERLLQSK